MYFENDNIYINTHHFSIEKQRRYLYRYQQTYLYFSDNQVPRDLQIHQTYVKNIYIYLFIL